MFIRDARRSGRWFPERGCILEHQIFSLGKMILRDRCSTPYDLASLFRGRRNTLDRWDGNIAKRIGTRLSALHSSFHSWRLSRTIASFLMLSTSKHEEVSQNCFVFDVVKFKNWGGLPDLLRFWCSQVQKLRKSRRIALFPTLTTHSITHSLTHLVSVTHSLTPLTHLVSVTHSLPPSLTHSLTSFTFTHITHSFTLTHSHSPHSPHSLTSLTHLVSAAGAAFGALHGVGCTPWRPLVSAAFCVAGAAFGALQGVGCTPWRPLVSAAFCVAGAAFGALQGVGCTPWRPLVSAAFCVAGAAFGALQGAGWSAKFNWSESQLIWNSIDLNFNWFQIQLIWKSISLKLNCFEIQLIWDSIDLRFNWFQLQLIWDSFGLKINGFEIWFQIQVESLKTKLFCETSFKNRVLKL